MITNGETEDYRSNDFPEGTILTVNRNQNTNPSQYNFSSCHYMVKKKKMSKISVRKMIIFNTRQIWPMNNNKSSVTCRIYLIMFSSTKRKS